MGKGKLLFKGDKTKKKKKKSKHEHAAAESSSSSLVIPTISATINSTKKSAVVDEVPTLKDGTGTITTSGTVVTGHDTIFEKEVFMGDAIMCTINGQEELRVITMRLSNTSLNLSSSFSVSIKCPQSFQYIRKPRDIIKEQRDAIKKQKETKQSLKQHAFDLYTSSTSTSSSATATAADGSTGTGTYVYREKTETGSYRIKRESANGANTRGDLLYMRTKKTSDKYC